MMFFRQSLLCTETEQSNVFLYHLADVFQTEFAVYENKTKGDMLFNHFVDDIFQTEFIVC